MGNQGTNCDILRFNGDKVLVLPMGLGIQGFVIGVLPTTMLSFWILILGLNFGKENECIVKRFAAESVLSHGFLWHPLYSYEDFFVSFYNVSSSKLWWLELAAILAFPVDLLCNFHFHLKRHIYLDGWMIKTTKTPCVYIDEKTLGVDLNLLSDLMGCGDGAAMGRRWGVGRGGRKRWRWGGTKKQRHNWRG